MLNTELVERGPGLQAERADSQVLIPPAFIEVPDKRIDRFQDFLLQLSEHHKYR